MGEERPLSGHDIIVIGASAGGIEALKEIVRGLPPDLPAAVFVVIHIPIEGISILPNILNSAGPLPAVHPIDGEEIQHGCIYVAPNDYHLLLERRYVHLVKGPKENNFRPAIDPLFRTAARIYGPKVVGIVLTGSLDDGTAGLLAVKKRGGIAIAQDPNDALFPEMPRSALEYVDVDYCLPLSDIAPLLSKLAREPVKQKAGPVSEEVEVESKIAEFDMATIENKEKLGTPSVFSCPECHGTLWEMGNGDLTRFRCRVGHAFSIESMDAKQAQMVESALWAGLRALEERATLERRLADQARQRGHDLTADRFEKKAQASEHHAGQIRQILLSGEQNR